jgi:hypothetical protein
LSELPSWLWWGRSSGPLGHTSVISLCGKECNTFKDDFQITLWVLTPVSEFHLTRDVSSWPIMTQNFVLNYHDCFWGPGIINIYILYFNCLRLFWHILLVRNLFWLV